MKIKFRAAKEEVAEEREADAPRKESTDSRWLTFEQYREEMAKILPPQGAELPRPLTLKEKDDLEYLFESLLFNFAMTVVGITHGWDVSEWLDTSKLEPPFWDYP